MSDRTGSNTPHKKVTPQTTRMGIPMAVIGISMAIVLVFILIAAIVAGSDDDEPVESPTPIPAPAYTDGTVAKAGDVLYVVEQKFFALAAAGQESDEQQVEPCDELRITPPDEEHPFFSYAGDGIYWVHARRTDDTGWNGWLPFDSLTNTKPDICE